jgi:nucleoside-diphosphate-sugar epimerase
VRPLVTGGAGFISYKLVRGLLDRGDQLNQVETLVSVLTRQTTCRGSFRSGKDLIALIDTFIRDWNAGATPFVWVKNADEILAKAVRQPERRANRDTREDQGP